MYTCLVILLSAFILDLILGDPVYPLHPVRLLGSLIHKVETWLFQTDLNPLTGGVFIIGIVSGIVLGGYLVLTLFFSRFSLFYNIFIVYSCIAIKDLISHGKAVYKNLKSEDIEGARQAVQMLIGRDSQKLDKFGIGRATVESLAENYVDGFLAPLFWFTAGCWIGSLTGVKPDICGGIMVLFYRIINTLDSMVGYKNKKYLFFGRASARLDDGLNFIPARFAILILTLASLFCRLHFINAWQMGWRDRLKHSSPNAGHPESCVAGALNIQLGGPGIYPHGLVEKPWLGDGTPDVTAKDLHKTFSLIYCAAFLTFGLFTLTIFGLQ